ncbi:uncharacterized protein BJ171DRAFT_253768 [Polychytrium aggregatum]|uniref:uncharacterized protein n=1 Tax=Polychytrium aggregatum TaxID=110093 RepID=UPI0022FECC6D|nr:uncharacterized protein BJ171DRAFT_253768 [Polychytrium aggregatum]KAI9193518.1 hypothetical protein BJ171DRAFT_253768 [Polychytrium aggregatum]
MTDISPEMSLRGQYGILSIAYAMHLYIFLVFLKSLGCPPLWSSLNALFFLLVFVVMPPVEVLSAILVPLQLDVVNDTASQDTMQLSTILGKVSNCFIAFYGLITIHFSHRSIQFLKAVFQYSVLWDYAGHAFNLLLFVGYCLFSLVDRLRPWRTAAQAFYAFIVSTTWLLTAALIHWKLNRWARALSSGLESRLGKGSRSSRDRRSSLLPTSQSLRLGAVRVAFYLLMVISISSTGAIGFAAILSTSMPNISLILLRSGIVFLASHVIVAWHMLFSILPQRIQEIATSAMDPAALSRDGGRPLDNNRSLELTVPYSPSQSHGAIEHRAKHIIRSMSETAA